MVIDKRQLARQFAATSVIVLLFAPVACSDDSSSENGTSGPGGTASSTGGASSGGGAPGGAGPGGSTAITPVYVAFAGHIEDSASYTGLPNCNIYEQKRTDLLTFAAKMAATDAAFNLQIEYEWLLGAKNCETTQLMASTNGKNIIDYLVETYGFEIDAHQEGGWDWLDPKDTKPATDNYADVRYLGGQISSYITETVGGWVWDHTDTYGTPPRNQFDHLDVGQHTTQIIDDLYQAAIDFTWQPEILTFAVGEQHHEGNFGEDDDTSGIWKPAGEGADFLTHDAGKRMIYIGAGMQHANWGGNCNDNDFEDAADYVKVLVNYLQSGKATGGKMYTCTIGLPQGVMFGTSDDQLLWSMITELQPLVDEGRVVYANFTEMVEIWQNQYGSEPNIYTYDNISSQDYTCP